MSIHRKYVFGIRYLYSVAFTFKLKIVNGSICICRSRISSCGRFFCTFFDRLFFPIRVSRFFLVSCYWGCFNFRTAVCCFRIRSTFFICISGILCSWGHADTTHLHSFVFFKSGCREDEQNNSRKNYHHGKHRDSKSAITY